MEQRCPVSLDTTGRDIHGEAARLREQGPAVPVTLPGGVVAWSVNSYAVIKQLLAEPKVTKSARNHWPDFIEGRIPPIPFMVSVVRGDRVARHGEAARVNDH